MKWLFRFIGADFGAAVGALIMMILTKTVSPPSYWLQWVVVVLVFGVTVSLGARLTWNLDV